MNAIHDVAVGTVGKGAGKIIQKGVDKAPGAIEATAGFIDRRIKQGVKLANKVKDGAIGRNVGKVSRAVLTDESSYRQVGIGRKIGFEVSNKPLALDAFNSAIKSAGDKGAAIFDAVSKDTLSNGMKNPFQLIEKSSDSLVG